MSIDKQATIIIKKYSSRRLYDTFNKCFISIRQLGELIRDNLDVKVIDKESGEDITKSVLTQVIMEEEKADRDIMPVSLLHQLIRGGSSTYKGVFESVLSSGKKTLQKAKDGMESKLLHTPGQASEEKHQSEIDELEMIKARLAELEAQLDKKTKSKVSKK